MDKVLTFHRSPGLCSHLTEQVVQLREANELLDFKLLTDEQAISCHRLVLAANSPMLRALLSSNMKEASNEYADLHIPYKVLVNIVDYMYSGVANIPLELLEQTLEASDYLALDELKKQCAYAAARHLQAENVFSWWREAIKLNLETLLQACQHYIYHNIQQVIVEEEYHRLTEPEFQELLNHSEKAYVSGDDMLMAVLEWVNTDPKVRAEHIRQYLSCICLDDCSKERLRDMMTTYEELFKMNIFLDKTVREILSKEIASDNAAALGDELVILGGIVRTCTEGGIIRELNEGGIGRGRSVAGICRGMNLAGIGRGLNIARTIEKWTWDVNTTMVLLKDDNLTEYSTLPKGISTDHSVCQIPGGLVLTGGEGSKVCTIFLYKFQKWSETTPMPVIRKQHASSFVNGLVFVLGGKIDGENNSDTCSVNYLNMKTSKWQDAPSAPHGHCDLAAALNQKVFVMDKYDGYLNSLDTRNMSWSQHETLSGGQVNSMCAGDDKLFVVKKHLRDSIISWYMVATDQWCTGKPLSDSILCTPCAMSCYKNKVVVVEVNQVHEYDTEKNTCKIKVTLPFGMHYGFAFFKY